MFLFKLFLGSLVLLSGCALGGGSLRKVTPHDWIILSESGGTPRANTYLTLRQLNDDRRLVLEIVPSATPKLISLSFLTRYTPWGQKDHFWAPVLRLVISNEKTAETLDVAASDYFSQSISWGGIPTAGQAFVSLKKVPEDQAHQERMSRILELFAQKGDIIIDLYGGGTPASKEHPFMRHRIPAAALAEVLQIIEKL